jgi:hypothetical protein
MYFTAVFLGGYTGHRRAATAVASTQMTIVQKPVDHSNAASWFKNKFPCFVVADSFVVVRLV